MIIRCAALLIVVLLLLTAGNSFAQQADEPSLVTESTFAGLKWRNIGPGFMSGRIADIAIHPTDLSVWYVAVGSGGVWKTVNAGVTWTPVFDDQASYSIGCVTIDSGNPNVIWVGSGENVGGRHVGFGDGVYRSSDGGQSWKNMGLKTSEHISKIVVHPESSDIVWVASQGPLWSSGGERGVFKTTDGGSTWTRTLGDDEWIGAGEIVIDPRDPNLLYAATWQRHRSVAAYLGGGPGSGLHRSVDGGDTWEELSAGLPEGSKGKIGLAISPQNPDVLYTSIELDRRTGGLYRSSDRGSSWTKMSDAVSGATGPHYYQELYTSPHAFDRLYLVDTVIQISDDGGKTFRQMNTRNKHVDDHAIAFRPDDPDYLLVGTDGGLYESFDLAGSWRFMENLPVTQFYKVALDDAEPFYNIYGGTQDNGSQGGPSRTENIHGIRNADWRLILDWDGHQTATEPGNPDIMYAERQEGNLSRLDLKTGENIDIQPQPEADEDYERYNWDAPILVSPHKPSRIYFASQRVWRSEDRGDTWTAISGDLTRQQNRLSLPIMGATQSWDNAWDVSAMSNYNTITSLAESPVQEDLFYAGTDDGLVQMTEDGGATWRAVEVGSMPGVPATAFVNDIKADLFDANTVYIALDNHKYGDFSPHLLKSSDRGLTWQSLRADLPERTLVWRLVQDHVNPSLLFAATEFGVFFTTDGGEKWTELTGGMPTIPVRDLAIHRRENDLVAASFGRGFFVLDDYSLLREVSEEELTTPTLFATRDARWYIQRGVLSYDDEKGSQGADLYMAPNPPFGAVFSYFLPEGLKSATESRKADEMKAGSENRAVTFPDWEDLEQELRQDAPQLWLTVNDAAGETVRRLEGPTTSGLQRVAWDLRYPAPGVVSPGAISSEYEPTGMMAAPGTYSVTLSKMVDGIHTPLSEPQSFDVVPLREGTLKGAAPAEVAAFWRKLDAAYAHSSKIQSEIGTATRKSDAMGAALKRSTVAPGDLDARLHQLKEELFDLNRSLNGSPARQAVGEKGRTTVGDRLFAVSRGVGRSTYGPTPTHERQLEIATAELSRIQSAVESLMANLDELATAMEDAGAPPVEGM